MDLLKKKITMIELLNTKLKFKVSFEWPFDFWKAYLFLLTSLLWFFSSFLVTNLNSQPKFKKKNKVKKKKKISSNFDLV